MKQPNDEATRHRYIRRAESAAGIDALMAATAILAGWGAAVSWVEQGVALLDADEQYQLRVGLTTDKHGRHAIVLEPGGSGWGKTLRLKCEADHAFARRLLSERIDTRQYAWRPADEPRIDGIRAHLRTERIDPQRFAWQPTDEPRIDGILARLTDDGPAVTIEATWPESGSGEAVLAVDDGGGIHGTWGLPADRRTGNALAWPPRAAIEAGIARAALEARRRATRASRERGGHRAPTPSH